MSESPQNVQPSLWHEPGPLHFDSPVAWWIKLALVAAATVVAILWLDRPIAAWAISKDPIAENGSWHLHNDPRRELAMLEQWGQWVCSILAIAFVGLLDRKGRRRAFAIAVGCIVTVLVTYLMKDLCGRSRPDVFHDGTWSWGGPAKGFTAGSPWGSFPSAHTTGAFALSVGLAWFYPRARLLFMTLATITAIQRILHHAHYLSDVLGGMGIAVLLTRLTLHSKLPGRLLALMPSNLQSWFLQNHPA